MPIKNCLICYKEFKSRKKRTKFCSRVCANKSAIGNTYRLGIPQSKETRKRISETSKKNGVGKWMQGRVRPIELRIKQSKTMKERVAKGLHNFWKGGIAQQTRKWRSNFQGTIEYKLWRTAVFTRDNYQCLWCGARNGNGKKIELNADHIQTFNEHPELRLAIDNGRTLCRECHYKRHSK